MGIDGVKFHPTCRSEITPLIAGFWAHLVPSMEVYTYLRYPVIPTEVWCFRFSFLGSKYTFLGGIWMYRAIHLPFYPMVNV